MWNFCKVGSLIVAPFKCPPAGRAVHFVLIQNEPKDQDCPRQLLRTVHYQHSMPDAYASHFRVFVHPDSSGLRAVVRFERVHSLNAADSPIRLFVRNIKMRCITPIADDPRFSIFLPRAMHGAIAYAPLGLPVASSA
ncbi:hypothetical protein BC643_0526 [Mangrovibacterium diazotrophicum]|uniref:Uncharacterized protein n=1 Tax=Mangrovibacterium diazotrophicum TaxID=1261403 RepID=A0A419W415_9BACT|nr:hypothetical protein BC643_0526 [Mangrovibacterium diazotrophicum]